MIAVLASRHDLDAARLLARSGGCAALLGAEDLTHTGWCWRLDQDRGSAVVSGQTRDMREIEAVLVRRPTVVAAELPWILAEDRDYVAAELHAFLTGWLTALAARGCRVVNRPTPEFLSGPSWRREQWLTLAGRIGLPVAPAQRSVRPGMARLQRPSSMPLRRVTVVGRCWYGDVPAATGAALVRLAAAAGVDLLDARVDADDGRLFNVDPHPRLDEDILVDAIFDHLRGSRR